MVNILLYQGLTIFICLIYLHLPDSLVYISESLGLLIRLKFDNNDLIHLGMNRFQNFGQY